MARNKLVAALLCGLATSAFACTSDDGSTEAGEDGGGFFPELLDADGNVDADLVEAALAEHENELEQVSAEPMPTASHTFSDTVVVWVNGGSAPDYRAIDTDSATSDVTLEENTFLVKVQYDDEGALNGYTLMVKGAAGSSPEQGDWWWGFAGASGSISSQNDGACIGCHTARAESDWVFGVPADEQL